MRLYCSQEISKPPAAVFPWIAQPERAMEWQKEVKGGKIITRTPGIVGTTFKETLEEEGNELEMEGVITRFVPDALISFHLKSRIHELDVSYTLVEVGSSTRLSVEAFVRWKFPMNIITTFIGKRINARMRNQMAAELLELRRLCESE